jgi:hypothetical protein
MDIETFRSWLNSKALIYIYEIQDKLNEVHAPALVQRYFEEQQVHRWAAVEVKDDLKKFGINI